MKNADGDRVQDSQRQLGLLDSDITLDTLPTAKMKPVDKIGVHGWTNFYAAFSEAFVNHAISALKITPSDLILDPFSGSGTTLVSALKLGIPAIGVDLDPFSCLLGRSKVAIRADASKVRRLLRESTRRNPLPSFSPIALDLFDTDCLSFASSVFNRTFSSTGHSSSNILKKLLSDRRGKFDSEVVAIAALCIGASQSANLVRGSNPTWYRKGAQGEKDNIEELFSATQAAANELLRDLDQLSGVSGTRSIRVCNNDVTRGLPSFGRKPITHVITSPPYLTRMDYVVKHLPHLLILGGMTNIDLSLLRDRMIGTPRIVEKGDFDPLWGSTCVQTLESIDAHSSYASANYYVWTYYQYFKSFYESLQNIISRLEVGGKGLLVVQDSSYKDLKVPLSNIVIEMLQNHGCSAKIVREESVRPKLQQLNPAHKKAKQKTKSTEDAIFFQKNN